jgi:hypothetical protein
MGKGATTMSKKTKRKGKGATSASKKRGKQETIALEDVLEIVLGNGCLHCEVKSSPVTKIALKGLLSELDSMVVTHEHEYCGKVYAPLSKRQCRCPCGDLPNQWADDPSQSPYADVDPRYLEDHDDWPLTMKCSKMIAFLTMLAANFRSHFDFDDLSRRTAEGLGTPTGWSFGCGNEIVDEILHDCPRRSTLMLNLAVLSFGQNPVRNDYYFNDAFLGTGPIENSRSHFGTTVCEIMHGGMGPFRDEELVRFVQTDLYPSP